MGKLLFRNLRLALILTAVWLIFALSGKALGGMLLIGGDWVIWFVILGWCIAAPVRNGNGAIRSLPYSGSQLSVKFFGLMLGVFLVQIALFTLALFLLWDGELAKKVLLALLGIAGSTSLLIPVHIYFRIVSWTHGVVSLLMWAGLHIWWEVVRNLWPDELFLGPAIGAAAFALSWLLIRLICSTQPGPRTNKAITELEKGKGKRFDTAEELFEDLGV